MSNSKCAKSRCKSCSCKQCRPQPAPPPPPPAPGDVLACGRLVSDGAQLVVTASEGIEFVEIGSAGPGARSWLVTLAPARADDVREAVTLFGAGLFGDAAQGFFAPRVLLPPVITPIPGSDLVNATFEFYIVNAAGVPIDPATLSDNLVISFTMNRCGSVVHVNP